MKAGRKPGGSQLQVQNVQMLESPIKKRKLSHYLVCHFAELPLKEKGPGLNSNHPFQIPLNFYFDRKVANLAAQP